MTYFSVTMIIIDQKIRLSTPKMWSWSTLKLVMPGEGLAKGVDRRGADVAEHDPDRADGQLVERSLRVAVRSVVRRFGCCASSRGDVHL